jgi:predicted transcriptional regulator
MSIDAIAVSERLLLLCVASGIDFKHAKIAEQVVTEVVVKGLIERDAGGHFALTDRGRVVLRAMLPDL